jgi:hypothetical protein
MTPGCRPRVQGCRPAHRVVSGFLSLVAAGSPGTSQSPLRAGTLQSAADHLWPGNLAGYLRCVVAGGGPSESVAWNHPGFRAPSPHALTGHTPTAATALGSLALAPRVSRVAHSAAALRAAALGAGLRLLP